jgi:hypothetical protein
MTDVFLSRDVVRWIDLQFLNYNAHSFYPVVDTATVVLVFLFLSSQVLHFLQFKSLCLHGKGALFFAAESSDAG